MKHYKTKTFSGESKLEVVSDKVLLETIDDFINLDTLGQNRCSLGAGLYKLRLASKKDAGKSGGSRSILAFKKDTVVYWIHLFPKSFKDNVTTKELNNLKKLSKILLNLGDKDIAKLLKNGEILEVLK